MSRIFKYILKAIIPGIVVIAGFTATAQRPDRNGAIGRPSQVPSFMKSRPVPPIQVNSQQRSESGSKPLPKFAQRQYDQHIPPTTNNTRKPYARSQQQVPAKQPSPVSPGQSNNPELTIIQRPQRNFEQDQSTGNNALRNQGFRGRPVENSHAQEYNIKPYNPGKKYNNYPQNNNRHYNYYDQSRNYRNRSISPFRYSHSYPYYGQRFRTLSFRYNIIPFGGIGYYYYNGIYYRPFGSYYQVVPPPPGLMISMLPFGYRRIFLGNIPFYYHSGVFYGHHDNYYQVVEPPLGAKLPALPRNAEAVYINGQRYFEDNGTYYFEEINLKNQRLYTVVGVNGVLDNETSERILNGSMDYRKSYDIENEIVSRLPENCSAVTINGHEYFRTPENVYYEAITDGNNVTYQVVSN